MQPELSPGPRSPEQNPVPQVESYEIPPNFASPETFPGVSPERVEQRSAIELAPPPIMPAPVVVPVVPQPLPQAIPTPMAPTAVNPTTANDDDDIEKEWVDRAKQVIIQTKDNPYAREKAIGELQRDYLSKRYGRQIGVNDD
ncbi:hypothetical protein I8H83_04710 [Candidatus Saccharibacteria bacterium]|nr:hypothetical protein [Candidatus Saccharibacteria bacterium]MBH2007882.1 hypothetical protein [Candidatus Saccharibacteria bacterium]